MQGRVEENCRPVAALINLLTSLYGPYKKIGRFTVFNVASLIFVLVA